MCMFDPIAIVHLKAKRKVHVLHLLPVNEGQLRKLTAFGIMPGVEIEILQDIYKNNT